MAKAKGSSCPHCEERLAPKQAFCGACGHPTVHASHDERVLWDLGQWEVSRRRVASTDRENGNRASQSAVRTKELFRSAQGKVRSDDPSGNGSARPEESEPSRRSFFGRAARAQTDERAAPRPAAAAPSAPPARPSAVAPAASSRPPKDPRRAPRGTPAGADPGSNGHARGPNGAPRTPNPARRAVKEGTIATRGPAAAPSASPAPARTENRPNGSRVAAAVAAPPARPVERRQPPAARPAAPAKPDAPLVVARKTTSSPRPVAASVQAPAPAPVRTPPQPAKPSRAERKAAEQRRREEERLRREKEQEAERLRVEREKDAAERKKREAKEAQKRARKHKRHTKRVGRRAAELDLRDGERVSLSIEGWSRFRRATLVVTNYRVALVTQMPAQVRWIPLEEVAGIALRWRGANSLVVSSPIEILTLQKAKREMLSSFEEILKAEVSEARRPGSTARHHGDITQEWAERSTEIWDSHFRRLRLWIRRHPAMTLGSLTTCVIAAFVLTGLFTSLFSPYR